MSADAPTPGDYDHAVEKAISRFLDERGSARRFHSERIGKGVNPDRCFADWLACVAKAKSGSSPHRGKLEAVYKTAMAESSGAAGGYLVPTEYREDLMRDVSDVAVVRSRCVVTTQDSFSMLIPMPNVGTAQANNVAPFYGGLQFKVAPEGSSLSESEPTFAQVELPAGLVGGYVVGSGQLIQDARGLESWLRTLFARAMAWYEDWFCLNGAAGGPAGIIPAPGAVTVARQTPSQFTLTDSQKMLAAHHKLSSVMLSDWERGAGVSTALWVMNRAAASYLTNFTNWFPNGPFELYGMPVALTTKQPAVGTRGDVVLADLAFYVLSDRQEATIDYSPHVPTPFQKFQGAWRVYERIGGAPLVGQPITLTDGSGNTVSPYVVLV